MNNMTVEGQRPLFRIQSSHLEGVDYRADGTLTIRFEGGGTYRYANVPAALWARLRAAQPHPWSTCREEILRYRAVRIAPVPVGHDWVGAY